ncbi:SUMF1/EgtB/PvdO family nonheme iron enzyme, partial [bacterium AH-315-F18]|nr:SUMF1/EgtB/PvdO family nonheme iron enzyme [bacterium AH-315-F18]
DRHMKKLDEGFLIGRHEVSVEAYLRFLSDEAFHTKADARAHPGRMDEGAVRLTWPDFRTTDGKRSVRRMPRNETHAAPFLWMGRGKDGKLKIVHEKLPLDWPVLGISWEDAAAYVRWLNLSAELSLDRVNTEDPSTWPYHLPSDAQWEKAARGVDGRAFVWGPVFDASLCLSGLSYPKDLKRRPKRMGFAGGDESVYGVRDMAGSMREWCQEYGDPDNRTLGRLMRGGSWGSTDVSVIRAAYRTNLAPVIVNTYFGIRVVRSARPPR